MLFGSETHEGPHSVWTLIMKYIILWGPECLQKLEKLMPKYGIVKNYIPDFSRWRGTTVDTVYSLFDHLCAEKVIFLLL